MLFHPAYSSASWLTAMVADCSTFAFAALTNRLCEAAYASVVCMVAVSQVPAPTVSSSNQDMARSTGRPSACPASMRRVSTSASTVAQ